MINMYEYPLNILNTYQEYLNLSKFYIGYKTNSIPVRYYNIDFDNSTYDEEALTTFDLFKSQVNNIKYKVYEFTPVFYTSPIISMPINEQDKDFSRFSITMNIQVFTIPKVYIGDLVQFYLPDNPKNLFRVVNFRVPITAFENLPVFELDLEPAPVDFKELSGVLYASVEISEKYIYDYSTEKYIPLIEHIQKYNYTNIIQEKFIPFLNQRIKDDLLYLDNIIPLEINNHLYNKIAKNNYKFKQLMMPAPYGIIDNKDYNPEYIWNYNEFNTAGGQLYDILTNTTINYDPLNINFNTIDFNNYDPSIHSDIENYIVLCYLIDKVII